MRRLDRNKTREAEGREEDLPREDKFVHIKIREIWWKEERLKFNRQQGWRLARSPPEQMQSESVMLLVMSGSMGLLERQE